MVLLDEVSAGGPDSIGEQINETFDETVPLNNSRARRMMTYFRSLQVCIEGNHCDRDIAAELFKGDIEAFLSLTCALAKRDPEFLRQGTKLADFVRTLLAHKSNVWNSETKPDSQLRCDYLRL